MFVNANTQIAVHNISQILKASKADYVEHVLPSLKPVMKLMEPIQILLIFMQVTFIICISSQFHTFSQENGASPGENTCRGCAQWCSANGLPGTRVWCLTNTGTLPFHNSQLCRWLLFLPWIWILISLIYMCSLLVNIGWLLYTSWQNKYKSFIIELHFYGCFASNFSFTCLQEKTKVRFSFNVDGFQMGLM